MICSTRLYSEYLVSTNNARPFPFKAQNTSLHLSTENRTFFEFPLSCIMHCCQFNFICFYLTDTGYAPNLFSKHCLSLWFIVMFKNICIFFFFILHRDYSPVSCPILSNHKDDIKNFGINIQSAENMSASALKFSSKRHLSSST